MAKKWLDNLVPPPPYGRFKIFVFPAMTFASYKNIMINDKNVFFSNHKKP